MKRYQKKLHRLLDSAYAAWGSGLRSVTLLHYGTALYGRQQRINRTSARIVARISHLLSAD